MSGTGGAPTSPRQNPPPLEKKGIPQKYPHTVAQFWEDGVSASDKWPSSNRSRFGHLRGGDNRSTPKTGCEPVLPKGPSPRVSATPGQLIASMIPRGVVLGKGHYLEIPVPNPISRKGGPHPTKRPKSTTWFKPKIWNPVRVCWLTNRAHSAVPTRCWPRKCGHRL